MARKPRFLAPDCAQFRLLTKLCKDYEVYLVKETIGRLIGPLTDGNIVDFIQLYSSRQREPLSEEEMHDLLQTLWYWRDTYVLE